MNQRVQQVAVIYAAALLQGLTMVSFPASSAVLKEMKGFTDAQYGLIFLPQIITAILGSVAGGALARRVGLKTLLWIALIGNALSQICLGAVVLTSPTMALGIVLAGTAFFGLAFGLSAAPLNTYPGLLFPARRDTALVALHTVLGAGLATGPLVAGWFIMRHQWVAFPVSLLMVSFVLMLAVLLTALPHEAAPAAAREAPPPTRGESPLATLSLWVFGVMVILYAFAEGTFANWSVIFLHEERGIAPAQAALALSVFWAMMAVGRLLVSALLLRIPASRIWLTLPILMISAFLLLPLANSAQSGIALFAFAGLACSAFFPVSVGLITRRFPASAALVSSLMIAALMLGVGSGSFAIGALRAMLSLENLYRVSTLYPLMAFVLAVLLLKSGAIPSRQSA
jgi:fucose permease